MPSGSRSLNREQARTLPHFSQLPPPDPSTRVGPHIADPAPRAALTGQAPAATATSDARSLNGGTRGRSGAQSSSAHAAPTQADRLKL